MVERARQLLVSLKSYLMANELQDDFIEFASMLIQPFNDSFQAFWSVTRPDVVA